MHPKRLLIGENDLIKGNHMAKIMIVDDEPDMRLVVRSVLEKAGHEIMEANGGEECLKKLSNNSEGSVDLIFLDVMMPGMTGWETLKAIKKYQENIPIAMLTIKPLTQKTLERKEMEYLTDYITKPFSTEDLIEVAKQFNH